MVDLHANTMERFAQALLDAVFPPACMLCDVVLPTGNRTGICRDCSGDLWPLHPPFCRVCGKPFEQGETSRACRDCIENPPNFDMLRAPYAYTGPLRDAIIRFKFRRVTRYARPLGYLLATAVGLGIDWRDYDLAMPAPLHNRRLKERGFNQSLLLAKRILRGSGVALEYNALRRVKPTAPQTGLSGPKRRENVRGAFAVANPSLIAGKSILLIDDIVTTGSTLNACAKALKKAGAKRVDAVAVARPVKFAE